MQIDNLPNKESKVMIIIMLYELGGRMDEHSEKLNKELENIKKNQTELKNTVTEVKNMLDKVNSRLDDAEKQVNYLEVRVVEITQSEQKKNPGNKL